jgi:hypothetical protein
MPIVPVEKCATPEVIKTPESGNGRGLACVQGEDVEEISEADTEFDQELPQVGEVLSPDRAPAPAS